MEACDVLGHPSELSLLSARMQSCGGLDVVLVHGPTSQCSRLQPPHAWCAGEKVGVGEDIGVEGGYRKHVLANRVLSHFIIILLCFL